MAEALNGLVRTHKCGVLTKNNVGEKVILMGWVASRRDLGNLTFVDLRDVSGDVQVVFNAQNLSDELIKKVSSIRLEYVLAVEGVVGLREDKNINREKLSGEIEILIKNIIILNESEPLPFMLEGKNIGNENLRLEYRYLDLRRSVIKKNLVVRAQISKSVRDYLSDEEFFEVETPILGKSTPEGARDYLVPSRVNKGTFYALPQSPQLYKQLLMIGGLDRYYQIAKCFRDEDLRADRQPEFTQVDIEMSFIDKEDAIIKMSEGLMQKVFKDNLNLSLKTPFTRLTYKDAMETYGSDKPDQRFGLKIIDVTQELKNTEFEVFQNAILGGGSIRAINAKGKNSEIARKYLDKLTDVAKIYKAKGLMSIRYTEEGIETSLSKFLNEETLNKVVEKTNLQKGDILLIIADKVDEIVCKSLGAIRLQLAEQFNLIDKNSYHFSWVVDFPMFEYSEEDDRYYAAHHPFTSPKDEDLYLLETEPAKVRAKAYDLIINGQEAGGGSIRISRKEVQERVFRALGFSESDIKTQFGFFVDAFMYGAPPHGGIAFGLDRLVMLIAKTDNIKDVIAFPKIQNASCLMTKAPSVVSQKQLDELSLLLKKEKN
ncbi:MAG: aspartate--tRNA ligase [Tenericutes bacterium HGW-Tenericutes-4]|nr:MAG: aspartate--tRNA ligase [Tenericutes bacterium HGW-Tenericutes-4]